MGAGTARCVFSGELGGTGAERYFYGAEYSDGGTGGSVCAPDSIHEMLDVNLMSENAQVLRRFWFGNYDEHGPSDGLT